ncbi:MAG: GNAT family N-acetyltransferase [Myxococcota bacterium]
MTVSYRASADGLTADQLRGGFFVGWPSGPAPEDHLRILRAATAVELALDEAGAVIGFLTAISDGVSCVYLPLLEVLPAHHGRGIGTALVRRMLDRFRHVYMVDLSCDPAVQPFYARLGLRPTIGMALRNYARQACSPTRLPA